MQLQVIYTISEIEFVANYITLGPESKMLVDRWNPKKFISEHNHGNRQQVHCKVQQVEQMKFYVIFVLILYSQFI